MFVAGAAQLQPAGNQLGERIASNGPLRRLQSGYTIGLNPAVCTVMDSAMAAPLRTSSGDLFQATP